MSFQPAPRADSSSGSTPALSFDELMRQLAAEHDRQRAVIEKLSAENKSFRARLKELCSGTPACFTAWGTRGRSGGDRPPPKVMDVGSCHNSIPQAASLNPGDVELIVASGDPGPCARPEEAHTHKGIGAPSRNVRSWSSQTRSEFGGSEWTSECSADFKRQSARSSLGPRAAEDGSPANHTPKRSCSGGRHVLLSGDVERIPVPTDERYSRDSSKSSVTNTVDSMKSMASARSLDDPMPCMWPEWLQSRRKSFSRRPLTPFLLYVPSDQTGQAMMMDLKHGFCSEFLAKLIIKPYSSLRLSWDLMSAVMVFYDMFTIPLMPFDPESNLFMRHMDWVTTAFWSIDVPCSFLTGLFIDGMIEMRPHAIARHYLRSWFGFDIVIVSVDWVMLALMYLEGNHAIGALRAGRAKRVTRILRVIRLLRFVRLQRVLSEVVELVNSEHVRAFCSVTIAISLILFLNHYLACGWYWIGSAGASMAVPNWVSENRVDERTVMYRYTTSLHWALTQFTPASMEVRPYNLGERVYSIMCLFFALVTFSSFLGTITTAMTQLRKYHTESGKQKHILRRYFNKNRITNDLSRSIWTYLKDNHFAHKTRTHKVDIAILRLLPVSLQSRLHHELYGPYVTRAPIFHHYMVVNPEGLIDICHSTVSEKAVVCGEHLFELNKAAEFIFFIISGKLQYLHEDESRRRTIGRGTWACEPVLWMEWTHCASLTSETSCEYIMLNAKLVRGILVKFSDAVAFVRCYAIKFARLMQDAGEGGWNTDLWADVVKLNDMANAAWRETSAAGEETMLSTLSTRSSFSSAEVRRHRFQFLRGSLKDSGRGRP